MKKKIVGVILLILSINVMPNVKSKAYTDEIYTEEDIITSEYDPFYGHTTLFKSGSYDTIKRIKENNYDNSYVSLDKYIYRIFEYDKPLEATTYVMKDYFYYLRANNSAEITMTSTESYSGTSEKALRKTVTATNKNNFSLGVDIDFLFDASAEVSLELAKSIESDISFSHTYECSESFSCTTTINPRNYDTWWRLETRSMYRVYKCYLYEIQYEQHVEKKKTWYGKKYNSYYYLKRGYKWVEQAYLYSMIPGSSASGIYEYKKNDRDGYSFNGDRYPGYTYLD